MSSLFETLGGYVAIDAAVDRFYQKVLADPRIQHFFARVDMERQRRHQKLFLAYALGGLPSYSGLSMRKAHQRLVEEAGLSDEHFDSVAENFVATLKELGVASELIEKAAMIVESTRGDVLNHSNSLIENHE